MLTLISASPIAPGDVAEMTVAVEPARIFVRTPVRPVTRKHVSVRVNASLKLANNSKSSAGPGLTDARVRPTVALVSMEKNAQLMVCARNNANLRPANNSKNNAAPGLTDVRVRLIAGHAPTELNVMKMVCAQTLIAVMFLVSDLPIAT